MQLKQHELSATYPSMPTAEFKALVNDIGVHGLIHPIVTFENAILDGWHRQQACMEADVKPRYIAYDGVDPLAFVRSENDCRRNTTDSQRAMIRVAQSKWLAKGGNQHNKGGSAPGADPHASAKEMAKDADVSVRTIEQAKAVQAKGTDALKDAVKEGKVSLKTAAEVATKPKADQDKALADRANPKKKKTKPEPEPEPETSLTDELKSADREIAKLTTLVESLKKPDLAKEVEAWSLKFDQLDGRLQQEITTRTVAEKQAKYGTNLLEKIRKALRVEKNSEILPAIEACKCKKR